MRMSKSVWPAIWTSFVRLRPSRIRVESNRIYFALASSRDPATNAGMKLRVTIRILFIAAAIPLRGEDLRIGMIGLDTSHVIAFTKLLNDEKAKGHIPGGKVVAAFKGGSPDVEASATRVDGYTKQLEDQFGVKIVPTIEELCQQVDAVLLESVDGR